MDKIRPLNTIIEEHVCNGTSVALEGFTHLIPFAAGHEIIRQEKKDLTLIRMTPDLIYDQMIGMGCAKKLVFSWGGNPGVGSLHRLRDAVENEYPQPLELEEHSHADIANAYASGAAGLPFSVLRGYTATDLPKYNAGYIKWLECPFTGERLAVTPAINPDIAIIHAQQADPSGNVKLWGISGVQKEVAMAAKKVLVTVEELVETFDKSHGGIIIPHWIITGIALEPKGAMPSYAMGYYKRNNSFYKEWDDISRDREKFHHWMISNVLQVENFAGHIEAVFNKNQDKI